MNFKLYILLMLTINLLCPVKTVAQPNYIVSAVNGVLINDFNYEFDIYILRTGAQPLELASLQVSIYFNDAIRNGGTLTGEYISGTSGLLNTSQYPISPNLTFTKSGGLIRQFRIASNMPPGAGSGSIISNTAPGTKFGRFRITNTVAFNKTISVGWQWNFLTASGEYSSYINAYVGTTNTNITNQANFQIDLHDLLSTAATFQLTVSVDNGWNMVSIPGLHPADQNVNTWWIDRDQGANVFRFNNGYHPVTTVSPGTGYWMKHSGARIYNTGDEWPPGLIFVPHNPLDAFSGWNLIGSYEDTVMTGEITTTPPGLQSGSVFGYSFSTGYKSVSELIPGYGYWIKLANNGYINLSSTVKNLLKVPVYIKENWGKIILTDNDGKNYTLYVINNDSPMTISPNSGASLNFEMFELPPIPPAGMFDVRYGSGRFAEDLKRSVQTIEINGAGYPIKIRTENVEIKLSNESEKIVRLKSGEEIVINNNINKLFVSEDIIPARYSLEQNYPNPFNLGTVIGFRLPVSSMVTLRVYDILGREVATLVNEEKESGIYNVDFDASSAGGGLSSGIYFYSITAGGFKQTKKMILAK
jgi:hypothetical protein